MSVSSKKRKKREAYEEGMGGAVPFIAVDTFTGDLWLQWLYHVAPFEVRIELQVDARQSGDLDTTPWLYVDNSDSLLDSEQSQTMAEAQYGAMRRVLLMKAHLEAIRANEEAGVVQLEAAATAAGLYGKRERRHCVIPSWTTLDETKAAPLLIAGDAR